MTDFLKLKIDTIPPGDGPRMPSQTVRLWTREADSINAALDEAARLAEAGTGYSQETVNALTTERDNLSRALARLQAAYDEFERWCVDYIGADDDSGTPERGVSDALRQFRALRAPQEPPRG